MAPMATNFVAALLLLPLCACAPLQPQPRTPDKAMGQFNNVPAEQIEEQQADPALQLLALSKLQDAPVAVPNRPVELVTRGMHSLRATKDIAAEEIFLAVELNDIMVSARPHPELQDVLQNCGAKSCHDVLFIKHTGQPFYTLWLALELLYQQSLGNASHFHSYISTLPTKFSTPQEWSDEDLALLDGTSIVAEHVQVQRIMPTLWHRNLFPILIENHPHVFSARKEFFTVDKFQWAMRIVDTRSFAFNWNGHDCKVLVPLADMANHAYLKTRVQSKSPGVGVRYKVAPAEWDYADGKFVMVTHAPVKANTEVFVSYGRLNNAQLLAHYGFTLAHNPVQATPRPGHWWSNATLIREALSDFSTTLEEDQQLAIRTDISSNILNAARVRVEERLALLGEEHKITKSSCSSTWQSKEDAANQLSAINFVLQLD